MSAARRRFNVMAPVACGEDDTTVWVKVGNAFENPGGKYAVKLFLMAVPVGTPGKALELFLYPVEDDRAEG